MTEPFINLSLSMDELKSNLEIASVAYHAAPSYPHAVNLQKALNALNIRYKDARKEFHVIEGGKGVSVISDAAVTKAALEEVVRIILASTDETNLDALRNVSTVASQALVSLGYVGYGQTKNVHLA